MFERSEVELDPGWTEHRRKVIGVRHRFRCDAEHRTRRASHRLGEFGL